MDNSKNLNFFIKNYLLFLWISVALGLVAAILGVVFYNEITTNKFFGIILVLLSLPLTMSYASLYVDIIKNFRLKLLALMPLLFFPKAFIIVALLIPIAQLVWLSYSFKEAKKQHNHL